MKLFREVRIYETFLHMNGSFSAPKCCLDTEARNPGYVIPLHVVHFNF